MGTTADKLNKLLETKAAIKNAIIAKGVEVADSDTFASYPAKIEAIEVGGESITEEQSNIINAWNQRTNNGTELKSLYSNYYKTSGGNTVDLDLQYIDFSKVTTIEQMFSNNNIKSIAIRNVDASNIRIMSYCFYNVSTLTELDLSEWYTPKVYAVTRMFASSSSLAVVDIRNFDLTNCSSASNIFESCRNLHTIRLDNCGNDTISKIITSSNFPTGTISGVTRKIYVNPDNVGYLEAPTNWIFVDSDGNEIVPKEPEIYQVGYYRGKSGITEATTMVNNTHTDLSNMFKECRNLTTINNIEQWDTSNVTNMGDMFCFCNSLTELNLSNFNTSKVENMWGMFWDCSSLEVLDLRNFDTSSVTSIGDMFGCPNLHTLRLDNCSNDTIRTLVTSQGFPTNVIEGGKRSIYCKAENTAGLYAIENCIFIDCITGEEIVLEQPPGEPGEPGEPSEKPAPPYEKGQFANNTDITVANTLVTKEHDSLNAMFGGCTNLAVVDTSDWDTSNVYDMNSMFYNCENLPYLDLSSFNTSNVENMIDMFYGCTDLLYLDISNFTVGEGCQLSEGSDSGMFRDCTSLLDLRLDNCHPDTIERIINSKGFQVNPGNVIEDLPRVVYVREENEYHLTLSTGSVFGRIKDPVYITNKNDETKSNYINDREIVNVIVDTQTDSDRYEDRSLDRLFENCRGLRLINGIEQWNTTGIENMSYMFAGCTHLVSLNLSSFDISNAHGIENMFERCENLRYLDISNIIMGEEANYYNTSDMFRDCNNLRHIRLDNCDRNTIEKIVHESNLPTGYIDGEKRKMYVQEANVDGLTPRDGWEFIYLIEAKKEEE